MFLVEHCYSSFLIKIEITFNKYLSVKDNKRGKY